MVKNLFETNTVMLEEYQNEPKWRARWLCDKRMDKVPYRHLIADNRDERFDGEIQNIHTLLRKQVILKEKELKQARLYATADDEYKLYFDGALAVVGPAQSFVSSYYYNALDVTEYFKNKSVVQIAAHVYYQGLLNYVYISADNLQGFLFQLELEYTDGTVQRVVSDQSWKTFPCEGWQAGHLMGYSTQFAEHIDARKIPHDWKDRDFDDGDWENAIVTANPYPVFYHLKTQPTPLNERKVVFPKSVEKIEDGHYVIDFGREVAGYDIFYVQGKKGETFEVFHAEELNEDGSLRYDMRCNCRYHEIVTMSGEADEIEFYDYKGFRYVEVKNFPGEINESTYVFVNYHYPFPEASAFSCSDEVIKGVWDICVNGVREGVGQSYLDCPTREKGGFLGDAYHSSYPHLYMTKDLRLMKKFLFDMANETKLSPHLKSVAPVFIHGSLLDYTLLFPRYVLKYYQFTKDLETVKDLLYLFDGMWEDVSRCINQDGLIEGYYIRMFPEILNGSVLVDWPRDFCGDYDYESAAKGVCTLLNLQLVDFFNSASALFELAQETEQAELYRQLGEQTEKTCIEKLYDKATGLFVDSLGSNRFSVQTNCYPIFLNISVPKQPIVDFLKVTGLQCSPWIGYFVIQSLFLAGESEAAYQMMISDQTNSWKTMLKEGATSCFEVWSKDLKKNTSLCHPWSATPISFVIEEIFGIKPAKAGFEELSFCPRFPKNWETSDITVGLTIGDIKVSLEQSHSVFITMPEDMVVHTDINGKPEVLFLTKGTHCFQV